MWRGGGWRGCLQPLPPADDPGQSGLGHFRPSEQTPHFLATGQYAQWIQGGQQEEEEEGTKEKRGPL